MKNEPLPLLIAKDKDAKICKDDYKLGWLTQDETGWLWTVWGSCKDFETVKNHILKEKGDRKVYLSEKPLSAKLEVQNEKLELKELN